MTNTKTVTATMRAISVMALTEEQIALLPYAPGGDWPFGKAPEDTTEYSLTVIHEDGAEWDDQCDADYPGEGFAAEVSLKVVKRRCSDAHTYLAVPFVTTLVFTVPADKDACDWAEGEPQWTPGCIEDGPDWAMFESRSETWLWDKAQKVEDLLEEYGISEED